MNFGLRISNVASTRSPPAPARAPSTRRRRGFSFTEVLFAVMILGIGFIMVAAIFPVAIHQAKTTTEETTGAAVARGGANFLEKVATNSSMPATGNVVVSATFDGFPAAPGVPSVSDNFTLARAIQGSAITGADARYAWVPFYRRAGNQADLQSWSSFAQVFMIPVLIRNESQFLGTPRVYADATGQAVIRVHLQDGATIAPGAPDIVTFLDAAARTIPSEGAFIIIANARKNNPAWDANVAPQLHGRIYRLGNPILPPDPAQPPQAWELMPGFDFEPVRIDADNNPSTGGKAPNPFDGKELLVGENANDLDDIRVFLIGRGVNPNDPGNPSTPNREGTALDVAAYTTFVNVKQ